MAILSKDKRQLDLCGNEITDYMMAEKFGMDWKADSKRAIYFLEIFATFNKRDKLEADKAKSKTSQHGNNRRR